MLHRTTEASQSAPTHSSTSALSLAALGVVFGDIGTSPLYTLKTVLDVTGGAHSEPAAILGALSLILWTLIIVTSLKYVTLALRMDNGGEGGTRTDGTSAQEARAAATLHHIHRSVRRGASVWRCRDHAGNLGNVGSGGAEHRSTSP